MGEINVNKNIKLLIILSTPVILALIEWNFSFSTIFILVSIILIYILIITRNVSFKNRYKRIIYKTYKIIMMLFVISFMILQSAILINIYKTKDIDNIGKVDTMIILGAKVNENVVSKTLKLRLDKAIEYYHSNKDINIIVSGGQGKDEIMTEALAMKNYLVENNVDEEKIILEDKATTTLENIIFSKEIIGDLNLGDRILIVTSDYNLFRGRFIASILGFDNEGLCSISSWSSRLYYMIREYPTSIIDLYRSIKFRLLN